LLPDPDQLGWLQSTIDNFCLGTLRFDKSKLYLPPNQGGLGLFEIKNYLIAQQSIWVKRAAASTRDNWRYDLWVLGAGNIYTLPVVNDLIRHPILSGIISSYRSILLELNNKPDNIYNSYLLNNPVLCTNNRYPYVADFHFWNSSSTCNLPAVSRMKIGNFFSNEGNLLSLEYLNSNFNLNLTATLYMRLVSLLQGVKANFKFSVTTGTDVGSFFRSFKKGSKKCRKLLELRTETKLASLTEALANVSFKQDIAIHIFSESLAFWNYSSLPNAFREFIFKFFHNRLGLNTRISHFVDTSRSCTICSIVGKGLGPFDDETFNHLFFTCPTTVKVHEDVEKTLLEMDPDPANLRWLGLEDTNTFLRLFCLSIQFFIWESKLNKKLPKTDYIVGETIYILDSAMNFNKKLRESFSLVNCPLSRLW
jgi:hypothetical protein